MSYYKKKFKNYGLWTSIVSVLMLILANYGLYDAIGMDSETFQLFANSILGILATLGIISTPESGKGYIDSGQ